MQTQKIYNTQDLPDLQEFLPMLSEFDQHLQKTINCDLVKHEVQRDLIDNEGLPYCINLFYIHSENGDLSIFKPLEETERFWDCNGIDSIATGAEYPDGELIKNNTLIIKVTCYL